MFPKGNEFWEVFLKAFDRSWSAGAARWCVILPVVALSLVTNGCGDGGSVGPPGEGRLAIERVGTWYNQYRVNHGGKAPPNEEAFVAFVESKLKERGDTLNRDELLTSPRDNQKYVIAYGEPITVDADRNVAVYEKEGYGGSKLVAFESGAMVRSQEMEDAELQKLLPAK